MLKNIFILLICALLCGAVFLFARWSFSDLRNNEKMPKEEREKMNAEALDKIADVDLLDPEMAPSDIHEQVMRGYRIVLHTNQILPHNVDDRLNCTNCHLAGGNTLGGKRGGISLVGVVHTYPRYSERLGKTIDLMDRINNCFERSMNGKALPRDSQDMKDILAYLDWISSKIPKQPSYPWLGLKLLTSTHTPDAEKGKQVYYTYCVLCHQKNGEGTTHNPPLWGPHAFNDGAGMADLPKMSSFIFYNMPYQDPFLTEEQALDVAAFLIKQRRPKFISTENNKNP